MCRLRAYGAAPAAIVLCTPLMLASGDALAHLGAGLKLFDLQRYAEATQEFELALQADPDLVEARYHLAVTSFHLRRYPDARRQFLRLLPTGNRSDWVTYYLGRIDLLEGDWESAIRRLESLEGAEPLQDELYYLGSAYLKRGEPAKAIQVLNRQVKFNPRDFRAHNLLARTYAKTGQSEKAEREFQEAASLHDYYLQGKRDLVDCREQLRAGRAELAWAQCGPILETDDVDKLVAAGMLFGEFASYDKALKFFERALTFDPDSPEVNYNTGLTYFQKKDYARAQRYVEAAVRLRPDFFEALALEGTLLYLWRDDAAALHTLRRAHQLRPDDAAVTKLLVELERPPAR